MIGVGYVRRMALYNRWQNEGLYVAAEQLTDEDRRRERGAFFGSIQKTFSHLLWADRLWMDRFRGTPRPGAGIPESTMLYPDWPSLKSDRVLCDEEIIGWAEGLGPDWLSGEMTYFSLSAARDISGPRGLYVAHFFNHQAHHRGQIHCMLTQAGVKPKDTDLPLMPD